MLILMENCMRCNRSDEEVRLFDGFYVNEPVRICEKCSILSNIPIVKRPTANQLKVSEKSSFNVRQRLSVLAGLEKKESKESTIAEELSKIEKNPEIEKPEDLVFKLVDNFHWVIQTARRRKGLSIVQLAQSIEESESALKMLEKGIVPNNSIELIKKIEVFFNIKLIKKDYYNKFLISESKPIFESKKPVVPVSKPVYLEQIGGSLLNRKQDIINQESNDMVRRAILSEKNKNLLSKESVEGVPLRIESFRNDKLGGISLADIKNREDSVERSFEIENLKTRAEIAREQIEDFGKEDTYRIKKELYKNNSESGISSIIKEKIRAGKTPTIYELMKLKEEKRKNLAGREISFDNSKIEPSNSLVNFAKEDEETKEEQRKKGLIANLKQIFGLKNEGLEVDLETGKLLD